MPPFPLLRLPRLVLFDVFRSLSIAEKIKLSLCSKKISTQIYNDRLYSQKVIVSLDMINQGIRVHSENDKDAFKVFIDLDIWKRFYSNSGKTCQEGFLSVIRHLLQMFQCTISTDLSFNNSDLYELTITELVDLQVEFKALNIVLDGSKDQNLLWNQISSNFGLVENLKVLSDTTNPGFQPVFSSWPQNISISTSAWFTLESLLACTSTKIILLQSHLENKDLDEVLRKWRAGELPNLEYLYIGSHNIQTNRTTILGMNPLELRGKVIQTDDGSKKATIKLSIFWIEMDVTPFEQT
ncbi:hypothetical protein GCK72_003008 [Caenorhabditis remanei]|uniref:F-box domain-containing protein n=1 Tax=Caenorhabditis remanei TaxID=31234 RepID=A0A6A5HYB0_CAERE|nr:hypothetical protein GCK72_003008 [Caenorhabditis remanei]KAF1771182.1 hypothetical protein GCK72_003008 [Caenorhabditis remanei]